MQEYQARRARKRAALEGQGAPEAVLAPYRLPLFPELTLERFASLPDALIAHALFDYVLLHTWNHRATEREFIARLTPEFRAIYCLLVVDSHLASHGPAFLKDPYLREVARDAVVGMRLVEAHRCARMLQTAMRAAAEREDFSLASEALMLAWKEADLEDVAVAFLRARPDRFCATAEGQPPRPQ
jgi:hypothetical protein